MQQRTKDFALRIIKMVSQLPKSDIARVLGRQVLRSGTAVAANYREASRARSRAEFISKFTVVEGELDETLLWVELLIDSEIVSKARLEPLRREADELLRIIVASLRTLKKKTSTANKR